MSNITPFSRSTDTPTIAPFDFMPRELALIRRTVAKDCNDDEFNLFIGYAKALRLDPRRRQIYAFIYSKSDAKKRNMSIIVGIDGFRTIADRTGCYRPDEDEPRYETDPAAKGPNNPAGLIKATVSAFKFSHGEWHKVTASAHWEEYAPLKEEWSETISYEDGKWPDGNTRYRTKPAPGATKTMVLDTSGNWGKMPRLMLAKVAEALALRKAWPDDFSNVYSAEEVDRAAILDLSPSEAVEAANVQNRLEIIGGANGLLMSWDDPNAALESVPLGKMADRCLAFIEQSKDEPALLQLWAQRNQQSLKEFWARAKGDALAVRAALDKAIRGAA